MTMTGVEHASVMDIIMNTVILLVMEINEVIKDGVVFGNICMFGLCADVIGIYNV